MWDRRTLERELTELGARESADTHGLREYQVATQSPLPVQKIYVYEHWIKSLNVHTVKLTCRGHPPDPERSTGRFCCSASTSSPIFSEATRRSRSFFFEPPFDPAQSRAIVDGRVPDHL